MADKGQIEQRLRQIWERPDEDGRVRTQPFEEASEKSKALLRPMAYGELLAEENYRAYMNSIIRED